jgi:predicted nucleotidyltransferase component of viral defense system
MRLMPEKQLEMNQIKKLYRDTLPASTLQLFESFDKHSKLIKELNLDQNLCLVGGTALALLINHRRSNDLDFACFDKKLPNHAIDQFLSILRIKHDVKELNDVAQISKFKIQTGLNLLDYARDLSIDDVKVTFFTLGENEQQRQFYKITPKITDLWAFPLMGLEGLKLAKSLVLKNRVRSRDLFDLMVLMDKQGHALDLFFNHLNQYLLNSDVEYYRAVMTGKLPLDRDDEGLLAVDVQVSVDQIYEFFKQQFKSYDLEVAAKLLNS